MSTTTMPPTATANDEAEIRQLLAAWSAAVGAKDLDGITANYLPETVLYDAIPPYKTVGTERSARPGPHACRSFRNNSG